MNVKQLFQSKTFLGILYGIGIVVILLVVFQAGVFVGFHKAGFAYRFGENYYNTFGGDRHMGFGSGDLMMGHGTVGKIVAVTLPTFVIEEAGGVEKIVRISDTTDIRKFHDALKGSELKTDLQVVVIGSPNAKGEIEAKLIRVMPAEFTKPIAK